MLPCQSSACKQCVVNSNKEDYNCLNCGLYHEKTILLEAPVNQCAEDFIQYSLNDLFEYIDDKLEKSFKVLKGSN